MTQIWKKAILKKVSTIAMVFSVAIFTASTASAQDYNVSDLIFSDGLSTDTNWTTLGSSDLFDWIATFGYDYGNANDTIPAAPGGSDTIGLKMEANLFGEFTQEIAVVHEDAAYTGRYAMQADIWMNWSVLDPEPTPTTEFGGIGVGHNAFTEGRNGALMIFTGDGGSSRDYRFYKDFGHQLIEDSAQYAVSTQNANSTGSEFADAFPILTNDDLAAIVPGQVANGLNGTQDRPGSAGFRWMTVTALTDTDGVGSGETPGASGTTKFFIESADLGPSSQVYVGEIDNTNTTGEVSMEGSIALFYADIFSSLNLDPQFQFGLFDNVRVWDTWEFVDAPDHVGADFNHDGTVDGNDFLIWQGGFGSPGDHEAGDADFNGVVDGNDFLIWQAQFGGPPSGGGSVVPEPTSIALATLAFLGLASLRRRFA